MEAIRTEGIAMKTAYCWIREGWFQWYLWYEVAAAMNEVVSDSVYEFLSCSGAEVIVLHKTGHS